MSYLGFERTSLEQRFATIDYKSHFAVLDSTFCVITGYSLHEMSSTGVYTPYTLTDITLDPDTEELVIQTTTSIVKTIYLKAFTDAGKTNYIPVNVEVCGLELITL